MHMPIQFQKRVSIALLSHETSFVWSTSLTVGASVDGSGLSDHVNDDDDNDESYATKTSSP